MPHFLFVYGTLMTNQWNNGMMGGAKRMGWVTTRPLYDLKVDHLPFLVPGDRAVAGELWAVQTDQHLRELDQFEGHPDAYRRAPIILEGQPPGFMVEAYFFMGQIEGMRRAHMSEDGVLYWRMGDQHA